MFTLGDKVRDTITGFEGVVTAQIIYLHGCNQYAVQCQDLFEGRPKEPCWFDGPRLEPVTGN